MTQVANTAADYVRRIRELLTEATTAPVFRLFAGKWEPTRHLVLMPQDPIVMEAELALIEAVAPHVEAYALKGAIAGQGLSLELQFKDEAGDRFFRKEWQKRHGKGGRIPKAKQRLNKKTPKRLYVNRMYRFPDGEHFYYFAKWDGHGNLCGKVVCKTNPDGSILLANKIVHRSALADAQLIPRGEEPWSLS